MRAAEPTYCFDTFDELRTIVDPKSQLSAAVQAAGNRLLHDILRLEETQAGTYSVSGKWFGGTPQTP